MPDYSVIFARSARKELEGLDSATAERILSRIEALICEPRPSGAYKLRGEQHLWRIRVGDYRIIYSVNDSQRQVDIVRVRHRREAYR